MWLILCGTLMEANSAGTPLSRAGLGAAKHQDMTLKLWLTRARAMPSQGSLKLPHPMGGQRNPSWLHLL